MPESNDIKAGMVSGANIDIYIWQIQTKKIWHASNQMILKTGMVPLEPLKTFLSFLWLWSGFIATTTSLVGVSQTNMFHLGNRK